MNYISADATQVSVITKSVSCLDIRESDSPKIPLKYLLYRLIFFVTVQKAEIFIELFDIFGINLLMNYPAMSWEGNSYIWLTSVFLFYRNLIYIFLSLGT